MPTIVAHGRDRLAYPMRSGTVRVRSDHIGDRDRHHEVSVTVAVAEQILNGYRRHRRNGTGLDAAAVQGAIFRAVKEATDHGTRRAFMSLTGTWPGEERPDPE